MRLLMLPRYDAQGASSRLRTLQYAPALNTHGIDVEIAPLLDDGYVNDLYAGEVSAFKVAKAYLRRLRKVTSARRYDAIWVEKELWPWLPARLELISLPSTTALIVDYDDAVFHRYDQHRSAMVRRLLGKKIDDVMQRANLVTVGNDYLAERARMAGSGHVEWLPTVIDLDRYPRRQARPVEDAVVIGWIGSPATAGYLRSLTPVLESLAARNDIRCVAIGARPDQVQGTPFEARAWRESEEVAMLQQFDIGIMPLPDAPWERGKCGYKLIQYMACTLPVVASPVGANNVIVAPGVNGELATSAAEWIAALARLIESPGLRAMYGEAGRKSVEQVYSLQAQLPRLLGMLHMAASRNREVRIPRQSRGL